MSTDPKKQHEKNLPEKPNPTDEVRPDIKAAEKPIESSNYGKDKNRNLARFAIEIRNDYADSD